MKLRPGPPCSVEVGNSAGWYVAFHRESGGEVDADDPLVFSSSDYDGDIKATLPDGLAGGSYAFTIEGVPEDVYRRLAPGADGAPKYSVARLYLHWLDTTASLVGYLSSVAGVSDALTPDEPDPCMLVAELAVTRVARTRGGRRYQVEISGRERVFHRLAGARLCSAISAPTHLAAIGMLAEMAGVPVVTYAAGEEAPPATELAACDAATPGDDQALDPGTKYTEVLADLERRMADLTCKRGRGMFLIRDGTLHAGIRGFPLGGAEVKELDASNGLIEIEALAPVIIDPNYDACALEEPPRRRQFKLTLKGRPDLKPGDGIRFAPPSHEALAGGTAPASALLGDAAGDPVEVYVTEVGHRLGRTAGFVTTVSGVQIVDWSDPWDTHTPRTTAVEDDAPAAAGEERQAALAIRRVVQTARSSLRLAEVGEVRQVHTTGTEEPPSQTVDVWRGLDGADGRRNQARRMGIRREDPVPLEGVGYLSPFAWGRCGLVLPRYPGERVALVHRNGRADDPVVAGGLWTTGEAPESFPGDWWLILPVGVPDDQRSGLADDAEPERFTGLATNDLIDADGNRIIEVGQLTVRITRSELVQAGDRPAHGEAEAITIEHLDAGSRIVMRGDGTVVIEAAADLAITAGGDVNIDAANVNVTVSGRMDVS